MRQDPVTGKWVVIATGRAKRPQEVAGAVAPRTIPPAYVDTCPFCNTERFPQRAAILLLPSGKRWKVRAFPNKFPAFVPAERVTARKVGLYTVMDGIGFHEVIATKAHDAFLARMPLDDLRLYLQAWRERFLALMVKPSVAYIQLIENHGRESGGTVEHPHVQLFALPVLPSDEVLDLLRGAEAYFSENGSCAYCDILEFEADAKVRIVFENAAFAVLCPFTSRVPAEQWVVPKRHATGFEQLSDDDLPLFAEAVQQALRRLKVRFRDPSYNLYVYSAPCDTEGYVCERDEFTHFHWHTQILPRMNTWGGLELATGLEVHSVLPEEAAEFLRAG